MAIFESRYEKKIPIDDTVPLSCVIETVQEVNGHIEYLLRVQRGIEKKNSWKILRRYNDFHKLHKSLSISGIKLPMPGKRIFGNMRPDFIAERKQALQVYINTVLMNPILASSLSTKRFIDPENYAQSTHDLAVQNANTCLRIENVWTLGKTFGPIGWRVGKHFFKVTPKPPEKSSNKLVKSGSQTHQSKHFAANNGSDSMDAVAADSSTEMVLEWQKFGPDKYIEDKDMVGIFKSLMGLQHPHIEPIVFAASIEVACVAIRKFHKHGTLKDLLCMATPKNQFSIKYGTPKGRTALSIKQVANYGRQILETLIFLHSKGYPFGHLHSGNIVIVDDCVKLLDIENFILGVPAFYRPFFVQHSKIHSMESIDVYCFGHILFEMTMGYPMQESIARQIIDCPEDLKNVLESILTKEACKTGLPTLEKLLSHNFFAQHSTKQSSTHDEAHKPYFKLSLNAKELLKQAAVKVEERLRDEHKKGKNQKRIVRVQELMSSEEERRQSKHRAKLEHKQSKLRQQGSLQANNGRLSLSAACGSSPANAPITESLQRSDSILSPEDVKSPPPTPAAQKQQQQQHFNKAASSIDIKATTETNNSAVERQSSTPIINPDDINEPRRSALLESICKFNRGSLRKVRSND